MEKQFLENIVRHLVDQPDAIKINAVEGEGVCIYELRVDSGDYGKIIGKHGQNAMALRTILSAVSGKSGKRGVLEIIE